MGSSEHACFKIHGNDVMTQ